MKEILFTTYTIALPALMSYIVWLLQQQNKKRDAQSNGLMLLLRVKLIEYHDKYCEIGKVPAHVYQNFSDMHEAYKALGGNGMITKMKEEFDELEIRKGVGKNEK